MNPMIETWLEKKARLEEGGGEKAVEKQHEKGKETEGDGLFFLNQVTRIYECLLCQCLTKCFCELVRTGCWLESALDSF